MAIHRRLDSFSLIFYLLLILWVKTELHQSLPPITSGFQLLRSLSANKYFCWTSRAVETLYLSWFFLVDPIISLAPVPATAIFIWFPPYFVFLLCLYDPISQRFYRPCSEQGQHKPLHIKYRKYHNFRLSKKFLQGRIVRPIPFTL